MLASYLTTYFMGAFEEPAILSYWSFFYVSPFEVARDLVIAALRILKEGGIDGLLEDAVYPSRTDPQSRRRDSPLRPPPKPGFIKRFIKRFLLGLPLVSAGSLVHMLLSVGYLVPVQWLARYRGNRNRRDSSRDLAALVVVTLLVVGALRCDRNDYDYTAILLNFVSQGFAQGISVDAGYHTATSTPRGRRHFGSRPLIWILMDFRVAVALGSFMMYFVITSQCMKA
jgi:hypothetical protein